MGNSNQTKALLGGSHEGNYSEENHRREEGSGLQSLHLECDTLPNLQASPNLPLLKVKVYYWVQHPNSTNY